MPEFSLSKYLTKFQTSEKRSFPAVENASADLNTIIDQLAISPEQIDSDEDTFESLTDLCHSFPHLQPKLQTQLTYLVSSSLSNLCSDVDSNLNATTNSIEIMDLIPKWKKYLEQYGYVIHVLLTFLHDDVHIAASQSSNLSRGTGANSNKKVSQNPTVELFKRSCNQIESITESITKLLKINISRIFQTTPEKDLFVSLFTRPLFVLIEVEPIIKVSHLKIFIQRIIAVAVKNHGQASYVQNSIMSTLTYFLHLSNFNAELLQILNDEYDYPQLTEEVLRDISSRVFNAKDTTGPKAISNFLIKLSELSPQVMLRQMSLVIRLLNNSSLTLRCSVVESCGNITTELIRKPDTLEHYKQQIMVLIELLEERFQDSNPFVRTKAIQGCLKICELNIKFNKSKVNFTKLAVRSLEDRSSLVRRNAVKLLSKLLLKHPFSGPNGSQLRLTEWRKCLEEANKELDKYMEDNPDDESLNDIIENSLRAEEDDATDKSKLDTVDNNKELSRIENDVSVTNSIHSNTVLKMKLMVAYFEDAVDFIKDIHKCIQLASDLLSSKNRNEVLETMDFLVLADAYSLELSETAIKKMLHLVWMKGTNDEGTSISTHLISCYNQLFLTTPENFNYKQKATHIANNLIQLTKGASLADLASLEQLLGLMYKEKLIDENVIVILWAIYNTVLKEDESSTESIPRCEIHGAIIVIGMLALTNHEVAMKGFDSLLNIGLGQIGTEDLILCKYTCLALERIIPKKSVHFSNSFTDKHEQEAVTKLYSTIIRYSTNNDFYPMCEQAISALFTISGKPDIISTEILKEKTMMTFGNPDESENSIQKGSSRITSLSQLLFIVGQIAIRTLVYLEKCEAEFKRRKIDAESRKGKEKDNEVENDNADNTAADTSKDNELEMIGGTNEDDFTDAIQFIKDNDLLFGDNSILGKFCPIVEEIVSSNSRFDDIMLQRTAALCLEKLMCVSSKYCEKSLPLLITVMEKSPDPIVRSNAVLGLGDMAVCFNNLVDENTDYLYRRLHDENLMVQRTCLMTVTFLILAGQVKVKGQLGEMAKCLENPDQGISDMCRLFFTELATKDNAVYNGFIDIFSNLSTDECLEKESFRRITKFLLSFIEKERHQKQLNEKLLGRLAKCSSQEQWDDIAFVLNSMPYKNEKATELLSEGFKIVSARE